MGKSARRLNDIKILCLVIAGILLNLVFSQIATALSLPFYLDCIGTILAAIVGGYFPAILVGFLSNFISGFREYSNSYYSVISVLIAIAASALASRKYFRVSWKALIPVLVFALIGGGLGSVSDLRRLHA